MEPRLSYITKKKLIGKSIPIKLSEDKTFDLWHSFMTCRKLIKNTISSDLISMQIYNGPLDLKNFDNNTEFEKWAALEVSDFDSVPGGMKTFTLTSGLYAVFMYRGTPDKFPEMLHNIFEKWLPGSGYAVDSRPHFEILGEKYKLNDPLSEEEIWFPVTKIIELS